VKCCLLFRLVFCLWGATLEDEGWDEEGARETLNQRHIHLLSKGNQVNIPELGNKDTVCGNTTEPRHVGGGPGKSSLFFLTIMQHQKRSVMCASGRLFFCHVLSLGGNSRR